MIENTQRDVNIALINELALIFDRLGIDTAQVLEAAGTKWNFLPFRPGLVGGHCIGVDPYYLTHKAQEIGYHPEMILAGRRLNDNMSIYVAERVTQLMIRKRMHAQGAKILVMGLAFKENCPDVRNSKVVDVIRELEKYGANVDVYDPWIDAAEANHEYGLKPVKRLQKKKYDAIVLAVGHHQFREMGVDAIRALAKQHTCCSISNTYSVPMRLTAGSDSGSPRTHGRIRISPTFYRSRTNARSTAALGERPSSNKGRQASQSMSLS